MSKLLIYLVLNYVYFEGEENFSTTPHFVPKILLYLSNFRNEKHLTFLEELIYSEVGKILHSSWHTFFFAAEHTASTGGQDESPTPVRIER